jgi:hypothetical protein
MSISELLLQVSSWCVLLPLFIGGSLYTRLDRDSRWIFYLVALATVPQLLTPFDLHTHALWLTYNIYTPLEFTLTWFFIGNKLQRRLFRALAGLLVAGFAGLSVYLVLRFGWAERFLNEWVVAADIAYLCWVFLFILESLLNEVRLLNTNLPLFWYISGLLLYAPCTIFVFSLCYYIRDSKNPFIHRLWNIQAAFNIALYVLYAVGLYKNRQWKTEGEPRGRDRGGKRLGSLGKPGD